MTMTYEKTPKTTLLVDKAWIYELSSLTEESKLLKKNKDKINTLHIDLFQDLVGRFFVDELIDAKSAAETLADANQTHWSDEIEQRYLIVLASRDFQMWYSKNLELLITETSGGELRSDGLVEYERTITNDTGVVRGVSNNKLSRRLLILRKGLSKLQSNLLEKVIKPNVKFFATLQLYCKPTYPKVVPLMSAKGGKDRYYKAATTSANTNGGCCVGNYIVTESPDQDDFIYNQIIAQSVWTIDYSERITGENVEIEWVKDDNGGLLNHDYTIDEQSRIVVIEFTAPQTGAVKVKKANI